MGFIEEERQLFQDFVAPEIRAIEVRLDVVEKKIDALDAKIDRNQVQLMDELHRMENYTAVLERLARLESKLQQVA